MDNKKIRVAITHGDTNGIGYELIFKAFEEPEMFDMCTPIVYGSPKTAAYHAKALGTPANFTIIGSADEAQEGKINLLPVFDEEVKVEFGTPSQEASRAAVKALDRAVTDYKDGLFDVLVTCPVNKHNMHVDGFAFPNSDKFIEQCLSEGQKAVDLMVNGDLRIAVLTGDVALGSVAGTISQEAVCACVRTLADTLRRDFRIDSPRIAVLALNPTHSAEHPGHEETESIMPAISTLAADDINVFGPYPADDFFGQGHFAAFDGILAMYHDQGVAPFRALLPQDNIHCLGGLPLVCTAPDQGPCYDIAGKGCADATAFRHAVWMAIDAFRNRLYYDEPLAHPLPKLYHERRDESEKVRFAIPKKRDAAPREQHESRKQ